MELRNRIVDAMRDTAQIQGRNISHELVDSTILLETGLDSLGFAILVSRLEEEFGYDPFSLMSEPYYPKTLAEFVSVYERFYPQS